MLSFGFPTGTVHKNKTIYTSVHLPVQSCSQRIVSNDYSVHEQERTTLSPNLPEVPLIIPTAFVEFCFAKIHSQKSPTSTPFKNQGSRKEHNSQLVYIHLRFKDFWMKCVLSYVNLILDTKHFLPVATLLHFLAQEFRKPESKNIQHQSVEFNWALLTVV